MSEYHLIRVEQRHTAFDHPHWLMTPDAPFAVTKLRAEAHRFEGPDAAALLLLQSGRSIAGVEIRMWAEDA